MVSGRAAGRVRARAGGTGVPLSFRAIREIRSSFLPRSGAGVGLSFRAIREIRSSHPRSDPDGVEVENEYEVDSVLRLV